MSVIIAYNVSGLYEGGELTDKMMNREPNLIKAQRHIRNTKPPLLYSPCYTLMQFFSLCPILKTILIF